MIDRLFKSYDIRGIWPEPLNEDAAWKIGYATATYFQRSRQTGFAPKVKHDRLILVGRDMRPHSPALQSALIEGIRSTGYNVADLGMIDTPFIYFAINHLDCVGGIQVTASHNPIEYNGFKISGPKARPVGAASGLEDIRRIAGTLRVGHTGMQGNLQTLDLWTDYRRHLLQFLNLKRKMRILVDASNGMAGWMIPAVFDKNPQLEIIPLLFETNGQFVHSPDPMDPATLTLLCDQVRQQKVDFGICFDGDADRCAFVDEHGNPISSNLMIPLLASDILASPQTKAATIAYDLRCSRAVPEAIAAAGGKPLRCRVGPAFLKKAMADNDAAFGAEYSGHFYYHNYYNSDSAAIAMAHALSLISSRMYPLSELVKPYKKYTHSGEINIAIEDKDAKLRDIADKYRKAKIDYLDGITVNSGDWWFNVRKSNTEPLMRLNMECTDPTQLQEKLQELSTLLGTPLPTPNPL